MNKTLKITLVIALLTGCSLGVLSTYHEYTYQYSDDVDYGFNRDYNYDREDRGLLRNVLGDVKTFFHRLDDRYWYRDRPWVWPHGGINISVDGTLYTIPNQASITELEDALVKAEAHSRKLHEDLHTMKIEFENLKAEFFKSARKEVKDELDDLRPKIRALAGTIETLDTKVVGPLATKLGKYKPTGRRTTRGVVRNTASDIWHGVLG